MRSPRFMAFPPETYAIGVPTVKAGDGDDERLARLEALLEAQQQRIQSLQEQVAGTAQDQDAARVDVMKQPIRQVLGEFEYSRRLARNGRRPRRRFRR